MHESRYEEIWVSEFLVPVWCVSYSLCCGRFDTHTFTLGELTKWSKVASTLKDFVDQMQCEVWSIFMGTLLPQMLLANFVQYFVYSNCSIHCFIVKSVFLDIWKHWRNRQNEIEVANLIITNVRPLLQLQRCTSWRTKSYSQFWGFKRKFCVNWNSELCDLLTCYTKREF